MASVNVYDLNVLCRIYDSLDYKSARKLDALCFIDNDLTLNQIIHITKHFNCFGCANQEIEHIELTD